MGAIPGDAGRIVGSYLNASDQSEGFIDKHGTFTTISVPGALDTYVYGINNAGRIVGSYLNASDQIEGFLDSGGMFTILADPSSTFTYAIGRASSSPLARNALCAAYRSASTTSATKRAQRSSAAFFSGAYSARL